MVDLITEVPGGGGGGNAGSSFSDRYFNIHSEADPSKILVASLDTVDPDTTAYFLMTGLSYNFQKTMTFAASTVVGEAPSVVLRYDVTITRIFARIYDNDTVTSINLRGPVSFLNGERYQSFQDASGTYPLAGDDADPPAAGFMGKVNRTAQSAAIGATKLTDTVAAGYYLVHYTLKDTTTQVGAATVQFQINYTDDIGATTQTGATLTLTTTGRDRGSFEVYLASGDITYQTNVVGVIGAGRYALRVRITALG